MTRKYQFLLLLLSALVFGCSSEQNKTELKRPEENGLLREQLKVLEKAKGVEKLLQDAADKQKLAIEERTR